METATIRFAKESDVDALIQLCALHAAFEEAEYDPTNKKQNLSSHLFAEMPIINFYCA